MAARRLKPKKPKTKVAASWNGAGQNHHRTQVRNTSTTKQPSPAPCRVQHHHRQSCYRALASSPERQLTPLEHLHNSHLLPVYAPLEQQQQSISVELDQVFTDSWSSIDTPQSRTSVPQQPELQQNLHRRAPQSHTHTQVRLTNSRPPHIYDKHTGEPLPGNYHNSLVKALLG